MRSKDLHVAHIISLDKVHAREKGITDKQEKIEEKDL